MDCRTIDIVVRGMGTEFKVVPYNTDECVLHNAVDGRFCTTVDMDHDEVEFCNFCGGFIKDHVACYVTEEDVTELIKITNSKLDDTTIKRYKESYPKRTLLT